MLLTVQRICTNSSYLVISSVALRSSLRNTSSLLPSHSCSPHPKEKYNLKEDLYSPFSSQEGVCRPTSWVESPWVFRTNRREVDPGLNTHPFYLACVPWDVPILTGVSGWNVSFSLSWPGILVLTSNLKLPRKDLESKGVNGTFLRFSLALLWAWRSAEGLL